MRRSPRVIPNIDQIEVVNEPLHDPPRGPDGNGNYIEALGGNGVDRDWDWIINVVPAGAPVLPECRADPERLQHHQ